MFTCKQVNKQFKAIYIREGGQMFKADIIHKQFYDLSFKRFLIAAELLYFSRKGVGIVTVELEFRLCKKITIYGTSA